MRNLKRPRSLIFSALGFITVLSMVFGAFYLHATSSKAASTGFTALPNSSAQWTANAKLVGPHSSTDTMTVTLLLRTSNAAGQQSLIASLYNKNSSNYHQWLSTGQFMAQFAPAASDVTAAQNFLTQAGLQLVASSSPTMLLATGTTAQVEAAFHTQINDYSTKTGTYYANSTVVQIPSALSASVYGVLGMTNVPLELSGDKTDVNPGTTPSIATYGGGPFGSGLTPSQIRGIYDVNSVYSTLKDKGQGTTLAVFELAGYKSSDITKYEKVYNLPHVKLVNIPVLGGATTHSGAVEVELDIELQIAMAPGIKDLLVYESPNTEVGALAQYLQIAQDNKADAISTSWAIPCENVVNPQITIAENQIFLQMAAQGQSIFAASGDWGAYGCSAFGILPTPSSQALQVADPSNQPYVTSVGGTSFRQPERGPVVFDPGTNPNPTYPGTSAEGTWNEGAATGGVGVDCTPTNCEADGGGVSRYWGSPDYQFGLGVVEGTSQTGPYCNLAQPGDLCREIPDVSLDADPGTGYSIWCTDPGDSTCLIDEFGVPGWIRLGGTSCAAPLWAGIAALTDEHVEGRVGLFGYLVYPFDSVAGYASQFHDITLYGNGILPAGPYNAGADYDMATGVGTPDIFNFINSFSN